MSFNKRYYSKESITNRNNDTIQSFDRYMNSDGPIWEDSFSEEFFKEYHKADAAGKLLLFTNLKTNK